MPTSAPSRPFSTAWTFASIGLFLASELAIGMVVGPLVLGTYVSPVFHPQLQMLMHLASFYLGGLAVGFFSPGVRLLEPAVGAFASVVVVFTLSLFLPNMYLQFDLTKIVLGGGLGFLLAMAGAWQGEKLMGNVDADAPTARSTARGRLRASLWERGVGLFVEKGNGSRE
jgi:hypothetical protein